jgi:CDP-diacylglycerol--glycerol-3-phosphate 3-phosphatidyltransferase
VTERSLVSDGVRTRVRGWAVPVALALGRIGLTPNALTLIGFAGTCVAAWLAASQQWVAAGILVIAFGIFDLFDGTLARATGRASKFGAFLDSTLDRTAESLVLVGIAAGAAAADFIAGVVAAGLALTFASGVTYSRARAESLGVRGDVGFAPREVRLVLLAATLVVTGFVGGLGSPGDLFGTPLSGAIAMTFGLGLIATLSAITIVQRLFHVRRQLEQENT